MQRIHRQFGGVLLLATLLSVSLAADNDGKDARIRRLTFGLGGVFGPVYSPAGNERLAFYTIEPFGVRSLWLAETDRKTVV